MKKKASVVYTFLWLQVTLLICTSLFGQTLHDAAKSGDLEKVEALLTIHPNVIDTVDERGCTAVYLASREDKLNIVTYLLSVGCDFNKQTPGGLSPPCRCRQKSSGNCTALAGEKPACSKSIPIPNAQNQNIACKNVGN